MSTKNLVFAALTALVTSWVVAGPAVASSVPEFADDQTFARSVPSTVVPETVCSLGFQGKFIGEGILVQQMTPGSVGERSGLKNGDVVMAVNGQQINDYLHYLVLLDGANGYMNLTVRDAYTGHHVNLVVDFSAFLPVDRIDE